MPRDPKEILLDDLEILLGGFDIEIETEKGNISFPYINLYDNLASFSVETPLSTKELKSIKQKDVIDIEIKNHNNEWTITVFVV